MRSPKISTRICQWALVFGGFSATIAGEPAQSPQSRPEIDVSALIERLGAPTVAEREAANRQLLQYGMRAKEALAAAVNSVDLERSWRAAAILERLESAERERRLIAFLRKPANSLESDTDVPVGWRKYRAVMGPLAHRGVFAEMTRAEPELMAALEGDAKQLSAQFNHRCNAQSIEMPWQLALSDSGDAGVGSVAALLLAGASDDVVVEDQSAMHVMRLVYRESFRTAALRGPLGPALSALVGRWVIKNDEGLRGGQSLRMATDYELPETADLAKAILAKPNSSTGLCIQALMAIFQFGDVDDLPYVEARFADIRVLDDARQRASKAPRTRPAVEIRNVALAVAVRMTHQSVRSYGFDRLEIVDGGVFRAIVPGAFSFADEARRDAAFKRWEEWSRGRGNPIIQ